MVENLKKYLFTTVFLLLLLSSACITFLPSVHAQESNPDKDAPLQNNPLGLDLTKYTITTTECVQDTYLDVLPQENIRYYIDSNTSNIDIIYTIANGKLRMIDVLQTSGLPHLTKTTTEQEMAKTFLTNCQTNTNNLFYGELKTMLDEIDANKEITLTKNNMRLDITSSGDSKTYRWTYSLNGVDASEKCVVLGYSDGFLKFFIDNWDLYKIGSTNIGLTEKEAIEIAMQNAETYTWQVGPPEDAYEVVKFNLADVATTQLIFCNSLEANRNHQSQDPFVLFPMWRIGISLDKFYPGNVYGIFVDIWANTNKVRHITEVFSTLPPPADSIVSLSESAVPLNAQTADLIKTNAISTSQTAIMGLSLAGIVALSFLLLRKNTYISKQRAFKFGGLLLCLLMLVSLFSSLAIVSADPRRRATIWGSEGTGDPSRKTTAEVNQQRVTSQILSDYFKNDGYVASNYQGSKGSYRSQILAQISSNEANYDRVAVIDFNHGVGRTDYAQGYGEFHYLFEDNIGMDPSNPNYHNDNYVYDMDIHGKTTLRKTFFTLINTCLSANYSTYTTPLGNPVSQGFVSGTTHAQSMPFAWTHKLVTTTPTSTPPAGYMSSNGYTNADSGGHCYMGFPWGSAALTQQIDPAYPNVLYYLWLQDFLYGALSLDITINQALDRASYNRFGNSFGNTKLSTGFDSGWVGFATFSNCNLVIYGNGNLRLYEYFVHSPHKSYSSFGSGSVSTPNGFTGAQPDGSYTRLYALNVNDQACVTGSMGYSGADQARGRIWIYGYASSYTSRLRVYVSNDNYNWYVVNNNVIVGTGGARWIDCGNYANNFKYISLTVYRENSNDYSNNIYIDSVIVLPPLPGP